MPIRATKCLLAALLGAAAAAAAAPAPPRLIVAISVDQFSADLFAEYRPLYAAGLRRLSGGVVFPSGYQSHAATETCPGHSTILTGSHPARTGIIGNEWIDQGLERTDQKVYCAEDPQVTGSTSSHYSVSARNLKVPTLGDRLKAFDGRSRVVAVAGKDRAAIMLGGHSIDDIWFWDGHSYVSLPQASAVPPIVTAVNARVARIIAHPPRPVLPPACRSRSRTVAVADRTVGTLQRRSAGDYKAFRTAPDFDRATIDIAIGLITARRLGRGEATDLIAIGLSATDYVGHTFGVSGAEMCAQILGVDANVGRILAALDSAGMPYVVVLTADHGGLDLPERNRRRGFSGAARPDEALDAGRIGQALADEFALPGPALLGAEVFGDIYLSRAIPANLRQPVLERARDYYLAQPQVAAVFTAGELRRMPSPTGPASEWSLAERYRASFDAERSGDLLVAPKPYVTPIRLSTGYVASHGSPWGYDRRVPILFYRPGMTGFEQPLPVETVDILPTLAALIGLPIPAGQIDGRCLDLDGGPADTCGHDVH
ncbi:MAG: alkaline phosphatase family protein [Steroidobacterales bacterium]